MSKAKRTVEERIAELNKREQDMLEKASRLKAQKKELEKRYKEEQKKLELTDSARLAELWNPCWVTPLKKRIFQS